MKHTTYFVVSWVYFRAFFRSKGYMLCLNASKRVGKIGKFLHSFNQWLELLFVDGKSQVIISMLSFMKQRLARSLEVSLDLKQLKRSTLGAMQFIFLFLNFSLSNLHFRMLLCNR